MSSVVSCRAKNPEFCPYHGSQAGVKAAYVKVLNFFDSKPVEQVFEDNLYKWGRPYRGEALAFGESLSEEERQACRAYTGDSHRVMNLWLRRDKDGLESFPEPYKTWALALDNVLENRSFGGEKVLYRGIRNHALLKEFKVGKVFVDKGYFSATGNPIMVDIYTSKTEPIVLKIKTSKGLPVSFSTMSIEEEYLLPRNSKFKVKSVKRKVKFNFAGSGKKVLENIVLVELEHIE